MVKLLIKFVKLALSFINKHLRDYWIKKTLRIKMRNAKVLNLDMLNKMEAK